jgi:hypothetical protein
MSSTDPASSLVCLDIRRALERLPWGEARAVSLFYLAGLPIRDIARHMGRPEGTIKRWLHLGRQHLAPSWTGTGRGTRRGSLSPEARRASEGGVDAWPTMDPPSSAVSLLNSNRSRH